VLGFIAAWGLLKWSDFSDFFRAGLIVITLGFGNVSFNILNEIVDREVDKLNKPWKPLPSRAVSLTAAIFLSCFFFSISLASLLALIACYDLFYLIGFLGYLTAFVYNGLQEQGVIGNLCLGLTYGLAALMATYPKYPHCFFSLAFGVFAMSYNVMVQWQDFEADKTMNVKTLPTQLGELTFPFSLSLTLINTTLITWLYLETLRPFLLTFLLASILVVFSTWGVRRKDKIFVEWLLRRMGRFLLTLGFIWMVLFA